MGGPVFLIIIFGYLFGSAITVPGGGDYRAYLVPGLFATSAFADALRELFGNPTAPANGAWPLLHPIPASLAWIALLLAVFVPLCTLKYARS